MSIGKESFLSQSLMKVLIVFVLFDDIPRILMTNAIIMSPDKENDLKVCKEYQDFASAVEEELNVAGVFDKNQHFKDIYIKKLAGILKKY